MSANFKNEHSNSMNEDLKYILENQQKELRAYDAKAGHYISSNTAVLVIALFTLCIFDLIHGKGCCCQGTKFSSQWWFFFILMVLYAILFSLSTVFSLLVLFPRITTKQEYKYANQSITAFNSGLDDEADVLSRIKFYCDNADYVAKDHIRNNKIILKYKHKFSKIIFPITIAMCVVLTALVVGLFFF